jgi:ubiquinol-cytochrome c reductase iron-sulfur subunit
VDHGEEAEEEGDLRRHDQPADRPAESDHDDAGGHEMSSGDTGSTDNTGANEPRDSGRPAEPPEGLAGEGGTRRRVIGTPPPAESRYLLQGEEAEPRPAEAPPPHDEAAARRAERRVALLFALTFVSGLGFIAAYVVFQVHTVTKTMWSNYFLGGTLTLAFLGLAFGITIWVRSVMTTPEITQEREPLSSDASEKQVFTEHFLRGADESGIPKRPLLRRTLLAAMVPLGVAPIVLLRDLGPLPGTTLRHTDWKKGTRLVVDGTGRPIKATDFATTGGMIAVLPEHKEHDLESVAKAAVILINIPPDKLKPAKGKENWIVNNSIIAYSKICTHVGCPAALYEQNTHHILCPCHQSTFDATDSAKVIFGPAARPLPQLPIAVDAEGYIVAQGDFEEPVGPSFWERGDTSS